MCLFRSLFIDMDHVQGLDAFYENGTQTLAHQNRHLQWGQFIRKAILVFESRTATSNLFNDAI